MEKVLPWITGLYTHTHTHTHPRTQLGGRMSMRCHLMCPSGGIPHRIGQNGCKLHVQEHIASDVQLRKPALMLPRSLATPAKRERHAATKVSHGRARPFDLTSWMCASQKSGSTFSQKLHPAPAKTSDPRGKKMAQWPCVHCISRRKNRMHQDSKANR